jgi:hypothetical protein
MPPNRDSSQRRGNVEAAEGTCHEMGRIEGRGADNIKNQWFLAVEGRRNRTEFEESEDSGRVQIPSRTGDHPLSGR